MFKVKRYVRFYASAVRLAAHGSGGLKLYCGTYEAGRFSTWNQRDSLTGFWPVRTTSSVEQRHQCCTVILASLQTVFSLIFLLSSFIFMRGLVRRRRTSASFTALEDCTLLIYSRLILDFSWRLHFMSKSRCSRIL